MAIVFYHPNLVNYKESRPRNLGRGVSKPKKNTVASLLAQSRAVGLKPMLSTQQLLSQGADLVRITSTIQWIRIHNVIKCVFF